MTELIVHELRDTFRAVPFPVAFLRILSAVILAGLVGAEREWRRKPAGLRTHMLVSLAACLYVIVGRELVNVDFVGARGEMRVDPIHLIEAVTAGVAFLVAGIVITSGGKVLNVTTGASLWLAGAIGLACGAGQIPLAALTTVVVLVVMMGLASVVQRNDD
ncbi:Mg(2+) transport ATPase protein C [Rubellimicrobium mesophilum DSM 19309]|uniref:Protein MgtC n=1 Tax=Rubellimicrobium mesophilum DSM 19309 TaxID=442562 RepID=A0A017HTF0_9RHOB|nr:MgtC/SapB family protein [Rubellimicrobium mesophilum]EYD77661.1 Mg(2+) transport ATPase protein C [Rubellimicrobium mesophilum DSM 19309]